MSYFDIRNLEELLKDPEIYYNGSKSREVIHKVSRFMNKGHDLRRLFVPMVKLLAHNEIAVKKCACQYIVRYASDCGDVAVLSVCSLVRETQSSNPMIRGLALRTLTSVHGGSLTEHMADAITAGLSDKSAYVRRIAVTSCLMLDQLSNTVLSDNGYIDRLYSMIRDSDPLVIVNCLCVLDEVLTPEGGIVINKNIAYFLINAISQFPDIHITTILQFLSRYIPEGDDEIINIVNILDPLLKSSDTCTRLMVVSYVVTIGQNLPLLRKDILKQSSGMLAAVLIKGSPEDLYNLLQFLEDVPESHTVLAELISNVYCKYKDPSFLKVKKLRFLPKIMTSTMSSEVIEELLMYCADINIDVVHAAMSSLSLIMGHFPTCFTHCVSRLTNLIEMDLDHIIANILYIINKFVHDSQFKQGMFGLFQLITTKYKCIASVPGRVTFLHLLSEYSRDMQDSMYMMENVIEQWLPDCDTQTKSALLTSTSKVFFIYPAQTMPSLEQIIDACWSDSDLDLRDRAGWYYQLLLEPWLAASVINGEQ